MRTKTCLITGCTRGLGRALLDTLHEQGYRVLGLARDEAELETLRIDGLLEKGFTCDLARESDIDRFITEFEQSGYAIDLLIHNAGIQLHYDLVQANSYFSQLRTEMQVNFLSVVKITSALLPALIESRAKIVAVSSVLQFTPKRNAPGYGASKAALSNWLKNLRVQLAPTGITVTEVIPGLIRTQLSEEAAQRGRLPAELARKIVADLSRERIVLPGARFAILLQRIAPALLSRVLQ